MAAKVIKIVFEIVMGNIIGIYYSANLNGPQKVLQIFKEILNCFIVLLLTGVLIRMFVISETIIYELELSGLAYGFLLIFVAIAVIQGPNIIQKIIGIDAGISDGLGTLFALSQGANLAASGVKGASSVIGSAGKGIGSIKQMISDKISSAKSASADNGLGSDIQAPPSMHNSEENDMSQKGLNQIRRKVQIHHQLLILPVHSMIQRKLFKLHLPNQKHSLRKEHMVRKSWMQTDLLIRKMQIFHLI